MLFKTTILDTSFQKWLFKDPENRILLGVIALIIVIQFIVLKFLYPFPNFMSPDSDSYISAALQHRFINTWPIGYSKFLEVFSFATRHATALVWFQYLLLEGSLIYFLFSTRFLLAPGKWTYRILIFLAVLNPLIPLICNFVSSDALFTALSLIWITQLFWLLYKPNNLLLVTHSVIILVLFMLRYQALYYPIISVWVLLMANMTVIKKICSIGAILCLLFGFIFSTGYSYRLETGKFQFSPFGNWQIAANALYGYSHAAQEPSQMMPEKFRQLNDVVNIHMDSLNRVVSFLRPDYRIGVYYLWDPSSPLRTFALEQGEKQDSSSKYFTRWATIAPLYGEYGRYLIIKYPLPFIKYFIWPNILRYYAPPAYYMGVFNEEKNYVSKDVEVWFRWKTNRIDTYFGDTKIEIASILSIILAISNLLFLACFSFFGLTGGFTRISMVSRKVVGLVFIVWLLNMLFGVTTAPIELRYQIFEMLITVSFLGFILTFLMTENIDKLPINKDQRNANGIDRPHNGLLKD